MDLHIAIQARAICQDSLSDMPDAQPWFTQHGDDLFGQGISSRALLLSQWTCAILPFGNPIGVKEKTDVLQGTLALMVLKTLDVLGPLHGYGIARRIEQISGDILTVNQGTLYPVLLKLEQEGSIASEWGASENNRKARFYRLTRSGQKQLQAERRGWETTAAIIARFFAVKTQDLK
jgi:PadR family transcriptional regulator PadR